MTSVVGALTGPTSHTYFSQRLRLHYLDWGNPDAPPLLLVHGNRDHAHSWDWVAARLSDRYHVVAPDLRGHGDSQWVNGSSYAVADYIYDIAQLIHQQQLSPLRIVAHSLGGVVSLRVAGTFPELVERLVVIEGTGRSLVPAEEQPPVGERLRRWFESGRELAGRMPRRYESLEAAYRRMQEANPHLSPEQARHLTVHGANQNEDGTYSWKFDNHVHFFSPFDMAPDEVLSLWGAIASPVLLLTGAESWQRSGANRQGADQADVVTAFRDARHVEIDDAGHWPHHDRLDRVVELVEDFLV